MATYWDIAAHSAYDMFSLYKYLIVNLFFLPWFLEWDFFLIASFPDHCLLVPFDQDMAQSERNFHSKTRGRKTHLINPL